MQAPPPAAQPFQPSPSHLLQGLRDIRSTAPEPEWFPPAPGWWLLAFLAIILVMVLARYLWQRWKAGAPRRAALQELALAHEHVQNLEPTLQTRAYAHAANAILKRLARATSGGDTMRLSGTAWAAHLATGKQPMEPRVRTLLATERFAVDSPSDPALDVLHAECERWLRA